jgi:hypothetical protein
VKNGKDLAEELANLHQFGYQKSLEPKMLELGKDIGKRAKIREYANMAGLGAGGLVGGALLGSPIVGGLVGTLSRPAFDVAKQALKERIRL